MTESNRCLDPIRILELLSDATKAAQAEAFMQHSSVCPVCRDNLTELSISGKLWTPIEPSLFDTGQEEQLIDRLRDHFRQRLTGIENGSTHELPLDALHPARQKPLAGHDSRRELSWMLAPASREGDLGAFGDFCITEELGLGGMGIVFAAEDLRLRRKVAIKVMKHQLSESAAAKSRFLREARAMAAVNHPHVNQVFQVGEIHGTAYIAMPLLRGETLDAKLQQRAVLTLPEVIRLGQQTALGLHAAHCQGLIHRDIKPSNIFCEADNYPSLQTGTAYASDEHVVPDWGVKILDFGLACAADELGLLTTTGLITGTPAYMSPEQARGELLDARTDLFSLGCVLYRAATGELPFNGSSAASLAFKIIHETPPSIQRVNQEVPPGLVAIIERLLAKNLDQRYQSALQVALDLAEFERSSNRSARMANSSMPASSPRKLQRWLAAGVLPVLVMVAAALAFEWRSKLTTTRMAVSDRQTTPAASDVIARSIPNAALPSKLETLRPLIPLQPEQIRYASVPQRTTLYPPGLVPQPHPVHELDFWQLETSALRGDVTAVAWSPDGRRLVCGTATGQLRIFDAHSWQLIALIHAHEESVMGVDWSANGQYIVSCGKDKVAHIWRSDASYVASLRGHKSWVRCVSIHPDGQRIATGGSGGDATLRLWDLEGRELSILGSFPQTIEDIQWSPQGDSIVAASWEGTAKIWNVEKHSAIALQTNRPHGCTTVAWTQDGAQLAVSGVDGRIGIFDRQGALIREFDSTESWVHSLAWNQHGELACGGESSAVRVWTEDGLPMWSDFSGTGRMHANAWSADGNRLATGGAGPVVQVHDRKGIRLAVLSGASPILSAVATSPSGDIAVAGHDGMVQVVDQRGVLRHRFSEHTAPVYSLEFNSSGELLASGSWNGKVFVWSLREEKSTLLSGNNPIAWNPLTDRLAYANGKEVRFWPPTDGDSSISVDGTIRAIAWTRDGNQLTVSHSAGHMEQFSLTNQLIHKAKFPSTVQALAWHPSGSKLAVGTVSDSRVFLLDHSLNELQRLTGHEVNIVALNWTADGQTLVSGGGDGAVSLWDADGTQQKKFITNYGPIVSVATAFDSSWIAFCGRAGALVKQPLLDAAAGFVFWRLNHNAHISLSDAGRVIDGDPQALANELLVIAKPHGTSPICCSLTDFRSAFPQFRLPIFEEE